MENDKDALAYNITTISLTIISILVVGVLLGISILSLNQIHDQLVFDCYKNYFPEEMELHGDFSGTLNCVEYYEENYANGKWTDKCSTNPFSAKMSCHDLCNIDCAYQNKINGGICLC